MIFIDMILAFIIAGFICKKINRNTFGTTWAYIRRYWVVWLVVFWILMAFTGGIK